MRYPPSGYIILSWRKWKFYGCRGREPVNLNIPFKEKKTFTLIITLSLKKRKAFCFILRFSFKEIELSASLWYFLLDKKLSVYYSALVNIQALDSFMTEAVIIYKPVHWFAQQSMITASVMKDLIWNVKLVLKYNTFFSVNHTLILVVVIHKTLPSPGAVQPMWISPSGSLFILINFCFLGTWN